MRDAERDIGNDVSVANRLVALDPFGNRVSWRVPACANKFDSAEPFDVSLNAHLVCGTCLPAG